MNRFLRLTNSFHKTKPSLNRYLSTKMVAHGQPAGIEIPAKDVARAADFYRNVFGWKVEASGQGIPAHKMMLFETPGNIFSDGGVIALVDEIPTKGATKLYVNVDDMEAAMAEITKNGGKQLSEVIKQGDVATYQYFEDTEGNKYGTCCQSGKKA